MKRIINILFLIPILASANANQLEPFEKSYQILDSMLNGKKELDFKQAVFCTENAYMDNSLNYETFCKEIHNYMLISSLVAKTSPIAYNHKDYESVNHHAAIFKFMTDTIPIKVNDTITVFYLPFRYNFNDYAGEKDWSNMFVSTLVATHKGNCHSMPMLYKLIAEEMGEKAWLAVAPSHFYIKLHNEANGWYNTELTSGQFPTDAWIMASGYMHTDAVKNGIYMDSLSEKESVAVCMIDLAQGYQHKYPKKYNPEFVLKCCDKALEPFPEYINALLLKAETMLSIYQKASNKRQEDFKRIEKIYAYIHEMGYRKMPKKMYMQWLMSLKGAKVNNCNDKRG